MMKRSIFFTALNLLSTAHKKKGVLIIFMLVMNSFLDFLTVASFLPLIFVVINPETITSTGKIAQINSAFNFTTTADFTLFIAGSVLVFVFLKTMFAIITSRIRANYIFTIGQDLSNRALEKFLSRDYHYFLNADYSKEINRISNQPLIFANNIVLPIANFISESLIVVFFVVFIAWYNVKIVLLLGIILLPVILFYVSSRRKIKDIGLRLKEIYPQSLKYGTQAVEGFIEIKTSGTESFFRNRFKKISKSLKDALISDHMAQATSVRITEIIAAFIICSLIGYSVINGHPYQQTILLLSIYAGASYRIIPSINRMMNSSLQLRTHEYVIDELSVLRKNGETNDQQIFQTPLTFTESISLRDILYQYRDGPVIFEGLTLNLFKGQKIAITGNSGEGKTTLLLLLMGLIKPDRGEIFADNKRLNRFDIFKPATYVSQNPYILDASIAENIAFGLDPEKIDRKKILYLLGELDLMPLMAHLPNGIDSVIGEKGIRLSGGQRQRLAIARALYADGDVLLFDEITNQLHSALEADIMDLLDQLASRGRTIVLVTHKINNPEFFNTIYRLEKGILTEVVVQA
jgi:ATP-binding cassette, subfamily B, bacterial PglK